jgi:hypothetical protein
MWPMLVVAEPVGADVTAEQRYARLVAARHAAGTVSTLTVALANLALAEAALGRWPEAIGTATEGLQLGTALQLLEYPISQVEHIQGLAEWKPEFNRWRGATDQEIVRWCGANDHVWVTQDEDARSRALRMGLLSTEVPQ